MYGNMNYERIKFNNYFLVKNVFIQKIILKVLGVQTGGRIENFDNNNILLSIGDYGSRFLAQDKSSVNGKIIKININNSDYEIPSMGHRNPQGLYYDKDNDYILQTEHGPRGGDEINLIEVAKINQDKPLNYGWAISSYGEHYGGKTKDNDEKI